MYRSNSLSLTDDTVDGVVGSDDGVDDETVGHLDHHHLADGEPLLLLYGHARRDDQWPVGSSANDAGTI